MTSIQLIHLRVAKQSEVLIGDTIRQVTTALQNASSIQHFAIGTELEDKIALQILIEDSESTNGPTTNVLNALRTSTTTQPTNLQITFSTSPFALSGPAAAPIIEYVQSWFPISKVTSAFRQQVERDFINFTHIFKRETKGDVGWSYGWVDGQLEKEDVEGGKAIGFIIARGWETIEAFRASTATESFKEAIPILYAWGAPHRMWFVERKGGRRKA